VLIAPRYSAMTTLPCEPSSVPRARAFIRERLEDWRCSGVIDDAELVMSEILTNAIRHTGCEQTTVRIDVAGDAVAVVVSDPGDRVPRRVDNGPDSPTGRGLAVVEAVAEHWGSEQNLWGKDVWAVLRIPEPDLISPATTDAGDGRPPR
jgi:anti-sigma regulatory factor (Ser/Thr protein kinase)